MKTKASGPCTHGIKPITDCHRCGPHGKRPPPPPSPPPKRVQPKNTIQPDKPWPREDEGIPPGGRESAKARIAWNWTKAIITGGRSVTTRDQFGLSPASSGAPMPECKPPKPTKEAPPMAGTKPERCEHGVMINYELCIICTPVDEVIAGLHHSDDEMPEEARKQFTPLELVLMKDLERALKDKPEPTETAATEEVRIIAQLVVKLFNAGHEAPADLFAELLGSLAVHKAGKAVGDSTDFPIDWGKQAKTKKLRRY